MKTVSIATLFAAFAFVPLGAFAWPTEPDHNLTPGKGRTDITIAEICSTHWGTDARHVTAAMKQQVIAAYNFDTSKCPLTSYKGQKVHRVEIDHLISRELGGADDVKNLWPECYEPVKANKSKQANGAHKKDRLENELGKRVCNPQSASLLKEYQQKIAADWVGLYHEIYPSE